MTKKSKKLKKLKDTEKAMEAAIAKAHEYEMNRYTKDMEKQYTDAIGEVLVELNIPNKLLASFTSMLAETMYKDALIFGVTDIKAQVELAAAKVLGMKDYKKLVHDKNFYERLDEWIEK